MKIKSLLQINAPKVEKYFYNQHEYKKNIKINVAVNHVHSRVNNISSIWY